VSLHTLNLPSLYSTAVLRIAPSVLLVQAIFIMVFLTARTEQQVLNRRRDLFALTFVPTILTRIAFKVSYKMPREFLCLTTAVLIQAGEGLLGELPGMKFESGKFSSTEKYTNAASSLEQISIKLLSLTGNSTCCKRVGGKFGMFGCVGPIF